MSFVCVPVSHPSLSSSRMAELVCRFFVVEIRKNNCETWHITKRYVRQMKQLNAEGGRRENNIVD